jgi:hypothetical protein
MKTVLVAVVVSSLCLMLGACNESQSQSTATTAAAVASVAPEPEPSITAPEHAEGALALNSGETAPSTLQAYEQSVARHCQADADCVVKNVGSCCGYSPQCVHKDAQTFPEQVKAMCEKEGRSSICGFQEPAGCSCVDNQCRNSPAAGLQ